MISVVFVPIVKNKRINICSKDNYRPIALGSIMSKILEKIIYERVSEALETCSNQFGFKAKHSTDMCILDFKEAIIKYCDWPCKPFQVVYYTQQAKCSHVYNLNTNILVYFADCVCMLEQYYVNWL